MTLTTERPPASREQRFTITARVLTILAAVARYGVLTSEQIARIDGGSRQKVTRILQHMVQHKLIRRADTGADALLTSFFDARPRTYAVTHKGLRCLEAAGMPLRVHPKRANVLLAHEVETAECMFAFNAAVATHGALHLVDEPELVSAMPETTQGMPKPLRLQALAQPHDFQHLRHLLSKPTKVITEPDRLFALALPDNTGWSFALELDRGTEDVTARRISGRATYLRKCLGYASAWLAGTHIQQWGEMCKALRVAVVTTSDARIRHMIETQLYVIPNATGFFVYATPHRIKLHGALGPAWVSAKRDGICLMERA